jgi:sialate O-acetylesterase
VHSCSALLLLLASPCSTIGSTGGFEQGVLRLPAILGDHMVVQRGAPLTLWGWDEPGTRVEARASWDAAPADAPASALAGPDGRFELELAAPAAAGPHEISVRGTSERVLRDVWCGEVWLASGQSNMEMPVGDVQPGYTGVEGWERELAAGDHPRMRLFTVENAVAAAPADDCRGTWVACTSETLRTFSATAYFFGRELQRALDVPVGLVAADWGGTPAEAWTSARGLAGFPRFAAELASLEAQAGDPRAFERERRARRMQWWSDLARHDPPEQGRPWTDPGYDDSSWLLLDQPRVWESGEPPSPLADWDGAVCFRRAVEFPESWSGRALELSLGAIDDMDTVWLDGRRIGGMEDWGAWSTPRTYGVPAALASAGAHVLSVRVVDTGGLGGLAGTSADLWIAPAGDRAAALSIAGPWRYARGARIGDLAPFPSSAALEPSMPSVLSNGMIAPLERLSLAGAIWYQGESNRNHAEEYRELFPGLIGDWRRRFRRPDLPFLFVQIAPFEYGDERGQTPLLRDAQARALALPRTGMAVTLDIGDARDIHPRQKQEVGRRLALLALARAYDRPEIRDSGPVFVGAAREGAAMRARFEHAGGLAILGSGPLPVAVRAPDGAWHAAESRVEGETLLAWSALVAEPTAVRYAWDDWVSAWLANADGLPAAPFEPFE